MSRIKYTVVPKESLEASIYESGVTLSEQYTIIDPIVVFNANMELGIETEIYGEHIDSQNIKFAHASSLLKTLRAVNDDKYSNTIIINGFDITLDYVRDHIVKLAKQSNKIFSINVISDKRKYTNFTLNLTSEIDTELSDEEWEEYKKDYEKSFKDSLKDDTEKKAVNLEDLTSDKVADLLLDFLFGGDDDKDAVSNIDYSSLSPKHKLDKEPAKNSIINSNASEEYEVYSYATNDGMISIERDGDEITFLDEEDSISVPFEFKDFIIEVLNKLK